MKTDIEIAHEAKMLPINEIASKLGIEDEELELYGRYKAKINDSFLKRTADRKNGKLILVTAINPTPAGEGKTTTTIGLADGMKRIGKSCVFRINNHFFCALWIAGWQPHKFYFISSVSWV